jgi:hypothetical protein
MQPSSALLVPEDDVPDSDSALGDDDVGSSTTSISSSILQYRQENGRTYHGYKESINYVLPNDNVEQERLAPSMYAHAPWKAASGTHLPR